MAWLIYGGIVVGVVVAGIYADKYARKHKLGTYGKKKAAKPVGRHAITGEVPVVENKTPEGFADFNTAGIPKIEVTVDEQVKPVAKINFLPPVPMAVRTDTTQMEAVNPADYPEWAK